MLIYGLQAYSYVCVTVKNLMLRSMQQEQRKRCKNRPTGKKEITS